MVSSNTTTQKPKDKPYGLISGLIDAVYRGATVGFGDELMAGIRALSPNETYAQALEDERQRSADFAKNNKLANFMGELAGGMLLFGLAGAGSSLARQVGIAAGAGALSGAGAAEGGIGERARGAASGGIVGGALGVGAPMAGKAISAGIDVFKARPAASAIPGIISTVQEKADELVLRQMQRDKTSPAQILSRVAGLDDVPVTALEMAGENTLGLARAAASVPGTAKNTISEALEERMLGQLSRVLDEVEKRIGGSMPDALEKVEDLVAMRKAGAATAYAKAYKGAVDDDQVRAIMAMPEFARAYKKLQRALAIRGEKIPDIYKIEEIDGKKVAVLTDELIPVQAIDYLKQAMDEHIEQGFRKGKIGRTKAYSLNQRLNELLDRVDEVVPEYRDARRLYAGDSQMIAALDAGRGAVGETTKVIGQGLPAFLKDDPRLVKKALDRLRAEGRDGELQMYKIGAFDNLRTWLQSARDGADITAKLRTPEMRAYITALIDDPKQANEFIRRLDIEAKISKVSSRARAGGAVRDIGEAAELAAGAFDILAGGATGRPGPMIGAVARGIRKMQGITDLTAQGVADRLLAGAKSPADIVSAMGQLEKTRQLLERRAATRAALKAGAASASGQEVVRSPR